jgi:NADPH-dependent ferric siderophore reductase
MKNTETAKVTVLSCTPLSPSMMRVVFRADTPWLDVDGNGPDEFCWIAFPTEDGREQGRYYTIRHRNGDDITVDFALHAQGLATNWVRSASPGETLHIYRPRFRYAPPMDTTWVILIADLTGLPMIGRVLDETPPELNVTAHVEIPCSGDEQELHRQTRTNLTWHPIDDPRGGTTNITRLADIARSFTALPDGPGYIYIAGEAKAVSECRKHFRDRLGFDKSRIDAIGYWIDGPVPS